MENINLGLMRREKVDLELTNDLTMSIQFVNKKALVNVFAQKYRLQEGNEKNNGLTEDELKYTNLVPIDGAEDMQYILDIYKADYIYRTAMYENKDIRDSLDKETERMKKKNNNKNETVASRELDIYLQYKQGITNLSVLDNVVLTELKTYYDKSLIPVMQTVSEEIDVEEINKITRIATGALAISGQTAKIEGAEYQVVNSKDIFKREFGKGVDLKEYNNLSTKNGKYLWEPIEGSQKAELDRLGVSGMKTKKYTNTGDTQTAIVVPTGKRVEVVTNFYIDKDKAFANIEKNNDNVKLKDRLKLGNKANLTEIAGFASYNKYDGKISGKPDYDSAPDNVNLEAIRFNSSTFDSDNQKQDFRTIEDDTAGAPKTTVKLAQKEAPRRAKGMVWEEHKNIQSARVNRGDGIYTPEEKGIPNKIVVMKEKVAVKAADLTEEFKKKNGLNASNLNPKNGYVEIEYIWPDHVEINDKNGQKAVEIGSLRKETEYSSYIRTFAKDTSVKVGNTQVTFKPGEFLFTGVPAGNFVLELPYIMVGNEETDKAGILKKDEIEFTEIVDKDSRKKISPTIYNGQDFKTTIFDSQGNTAIGKDPNRTWMPLKPEKNRSYGRDNEYSRYMMFNHSKNINGYKGYLLSLIDKAENNGEHKLKEQISDLANVKAETPNINFGVEYYGGKAKSNDLYNKFDNIFAVPGVTKIEGGGYIQAPQEAIEKIYQDINIGLIERPRTKQVLDKQIERITIKTSDGNKILDAKYNTTWNDENIRMPEVDKKILQSLGKKDNFAPIRTSNRYETEEYILKLHTEVDKESLKGDSAAPMLAKIYSTQKPYWEDAKTQNDMYQNSRGWENIFKKPPVRNANGYVYINFDKEILSDANIEMQYRIVGYNLSEVDRNPVKEQYQEVTKEKLDQARRSEYLAKNVGLMAAPGEKFSKLNHELNPERYGFGRIYGKTYYTGDYKVGVDKASKSQISTVLEYIDNSGVKSLTENDQWIEIKDPKELEGYVTVYKGHGKSKTQKFKDFAKKDFADPDGKSYFKEQGSNIFKSKEFAKKTVPFYEDIALRKIGQQTGETSKVEALIGVKRLASQQADDLAFDNIAEIVEYETEAGRRAPSSVPGNIDTRESETFGGNKLEPDTALSSLVTITPPTGLSNLEKTTISVYNTLIASLVSMTFVGIVIKVILDKKHKTTKEDANKNS